MRDAALRKVPVFLLCVLLTLALEIGCGPDDSGDDPSTGSGQAGGESDDDFGSDDDSVSDDDAVDDDVGDDSTDDDLDDDSADDDADDDSGDDDTGPHDYVGAVVGYINTDEVYQPIVWRDDHGAWTQETLPESEYEIWLNDVVMLDAQNGWAGGMARSAEEDHAVLYRRTETGWNEVPLDPADGCIDIADLDFLSADYGWAMCGYKNSALAYRYENGVWSALDNPAPPDTMPFVTAAFDLVGPEHFFVAGLLADMGGLAQFYEWDHGDFVDGLGGSWFDWYDGVAVEGDDGWVARCTWRAMYYPPELYHYDGSDWQTAGDLGGYYGCVSRFARSPSGTWYAAAGGGGPAVFRWSGSEWELLPGGDTRSIGAGFNEMDVRSDTFAVAVGASYLEHYQSGPGLVMMYKGSRWNSVSEPSSVTNAVYQGVSYVSDPR